MKSSIPLTLLQMTIWTVGLILAVVRRPRHPRVSSIAVVAFAIFPAMSVFDILRRMWLPGLLYGQYRRYLGAILPAVWVVDAIDMALATGVYAAWVLVLIAIFGWRGQPALSSPASQPGAGRQGDCAI